MYHRLDVDRILNLWKYQGDIPLIRSSWLINQPTWRVENQPNEQQTSHNLFAAWLTMVDMMTGTRGHSFRRWSYWTLRKYPWCVVSRSFKIYVPVPCNHSKHKRNQKSLGLQLGCSPSQGSLMCPLCADRFQTRIDGSCNVHLCVFLYWYSRWYVLKRNEAIKLLLSSNLRSFLRYMFFPDIWFQCSHLLQLSLFSFTPNTLDTPWSGCVWWTPSSGKPCRGRSETTQLVNLDLLKAASREGIGISKAGQLPLHPLNWQHGYSTENDGLVKAFPFRWWLLCNITYTYTYMYVRF